MDGSQATRDPSTANPPARPPNQQQHPTTDAPQPTVQANARPQNPAPQTASNAYAETRTSGDPPDTRPHQRMPPNRHPHHAHALQRATLQNDLAHPHRA